MVVGLCLFGRHVVHVFLIKGIPLSGRSGIENSLPSALPSHLHRAGSCYSMPAVAR
jgi:hypothetical protein